MAFPQISHEPRHVQIIRPTSFRLRPNRGPIPRSPWHQPFSLLPQTEASVFVDVVIDNQNLLPQDHNARNKKDARQSLIKADIEVNKGFAAEGRPR